MKRWLPIAGLAIDILLVSALVFEPLLMEASEISWVGDPWTGLSVIGLALGLGIVGSLLASHRGDQAIGWLMLAYGVMFAAQLVLEDHLVRTFEGGESLATGLMVTGINALSAITLALLTTLMVVFPSGEPSSPRWRAAVAVVWIATALAATLAPFSSYEYQGEKLAIEVPSLLPIQDASNFGFALLLPVFAVMAAAGVRIVRLLFGGTPVERRQVMWVSFTLGLVGVALLMAPWLSAAATVAGVIAGIGIPVSLGIAITKYRLYEIDVVVSKAISYAVLGAFITGVYAVIVVGIGSWVGGGSDLALSVAAVAIVAVAFEPVRVRVQRWANVLVYGRRATPYEVLSAATVRLSESSDPDEALRDVTRLVVEGTGASVVVLWLVVGDVLAPQTSTPSEAVDGLVPVGVSDSMLDAVPGDRVVGVRHRGEVLGALSITKSRGDAVTGADDKVLADVAAGAGVLLRNIGLNVELAERAEQLRVSRRRLVEAHDAERHRLERDLHDGAQQQVVALKVKLGIARTLAEREGADRVAELIGSLSETTQEAVDQMRSVAHGIYPPLLEAEGLEAALGAAKRTIPIPVEIVAAGIGRFERSVEESLYFAVKGILTNAVDGGATRAVISLTAENDTVGFTIDVDTTVGDLVTVHDRIGALDGTADTKDEQDRSGAGLNGIADRIDTIGGSCTIESAPGRGMVVAGAVPISDG